MDTPQSDPAASPLAFQIAQLTVEIQGLRSDMQELLAAQNRREQQFAHLSTQIDRFLAAELDTTGTLVQVREVVGSNRDIVLQLQKTVGQLIRTTEATVQLAVGDPGLHARERGGRGD